MKNMEKVKKYREDICEAMGVKLLPEDLETDHFMGRFMGQQLDYLDSLGLINRGFCPLCGYEPINKDFYRGFRFSKAKQYLCENCYSRTNLSIDDLENQYPGYKRRFYTIKIIKWAFIIIVFYIVYKIIF